MIRLRVIATSVALLGVSMSSPASTPPQFLPGDADWFNYDVLVELQDLPRAYTCADLWYKFRDVLLTIGAAPNADITPLRCGGRSPEVQARFSMPHVLRGMELRYATIQAVTSEVELTPGHPAHLEESDCALVLQMKDTLLRDLPIRVVGAELPCGASVAHSRPFSLTLETLKAAPESQLSPRSQ